MDIQTQVFRHTLYDLKLTPEQVVEVLRLPEGTSLNELARRSDFLNGYFLSRSEWRAREDAFEIWESGFGLRWVHIGQLDYPVNLRLLSSPPLIFSYQGTPFWNQTLNISVVGSRHPLRDSLEWLRRYLPPALRAKNCGLISGGARGVDQWAHELALLARRPTACLLPSGLMEPYPAQWQTRFFDIRAGGGAIISGFAPDAVMRKSYFHIRNRWIAGFSKVCLIAEANRRSGSWLTARLALEEGRRICTLPVSPLSERGLGNLDLLHDGAHLLRDDADLKQLLESEA